VRSDSSGKVTRQWLHEIKLDGFRIIAGKKGYRCGSTVVPALTSPTAFR
jgi:ATP-dependent DNA ligase